MDQPFDEQDVHDIIAQALREDPEVLKPKRSLPLAWNEGRLLEVLAERLPKYLHQADVVSILDDLRTELHAGLNLGHVKDLHQITKACRKCPAMIPEPHLPQWNRVDPDVAFVADVPMIGTNTAGFFVESLKRVGFQSARVMLTYVNRCVVAEKRKPNPAEISNCLGYLHTELQLVRPKVIVPLGTAACAGLFGAPIKLVEDRGRTCWLGPWCIVPTLSPAHVLKGAGNLEDQFLQDLHHVYDVTYGEN